MVSGVLSMREKLEACFKRLQNLDIQPTLPNMEKLVQTLYDLRDVYESLEKEAEDDRNTADSE